MPVHRSTLAAIAATCFLTLFAAEGSGANADNGTSIAATTPPPTEQTAAEPSPVEFTAHEVVQRLAGDDAAADAPNAQSLAALVEAMPHGAALSRELECLAGYAGRG